MLIGNRNGWLGFDRARTMQMPNQGASWTPASLGSSLKGWWKADAGVRARTAAQFTTANSESLSVASNASLINGTDENFWWAGWYNPDSLITTDHAIVGKDADAGNRDLFIYLAAGAGTMNAVAYFGGTAKVVTSTAGVVGTHHFMFAWYDKVAATWNVKVNAAALGSIATGGGAPYASGAVLAIGARTFAGNQAYFNGRIGQVAFGKANTETFANIEAALYNAGAGLDLADVTTAQKTAWGAVSAWPCKENSGTRADIWGANTLTDNNTVTANDGKVDYAAATTDVLWKWIDQSAGALLPVQATQANKPTLVANVLNSRAVVRFDGTDDTLKVATGAISNQPLWGWMVIDDNDAGTRFYFDGGAASKVSLSHTTDLIVNAGAAVGAADTSGAPHLVTFIVNGASSDLRVDGASIATGDAGAQNMDSGIAIGADNAGASPLAGDIAEIGFAAGSPTAANLASLKAYITARYGLTIA